jgi:hypothetical protein
MAQQHDKALARAIKAAGGCSRWPSGSPRGASPCVFALKAEPRGGPHRNASGRARELVAAGLLIEAWTVSPTDKERGKRVGWVASGWEFCLIDKRLQYAKRPDTPVDGTEMSGLPAPVGGPFGRGYTLPGTEPPITPTALPLEQKSLIEKADRAYMHRFPTGARLTVTRRRANPGIDAAVGKFMSGPRTTCARRRVVDARCLQDG